MTMQQEKIYLTPMPVRIWHWLNAFGIVTLCITGIQIRFPEYVNIFGTYKAAIKLHNTAGIMVSISYFFWFFYYLFVARSMAKLYLPNLDDIKRGIFRQAIFYHFGYFLGKTNPHKPTPENKFNAIQKSSYMIIMLVFLPLIIVSGLLLMNIGPMWWWIIMFGGIKFLVDIHYLIACSVFAFLCVHIYMATLGHTFFAHFKQMWTGWEEVENHTLEDFREPL
jgi:thiosulfate reductase cytochrome b subunit